MTTVEGVSAEVRAAKEEHQKELSDVRELVHSVQEESQREREGILASLVAAQGDREAVRESLALTEERKCGPGGWGWVVGEGAVVVEMGGGVEIGVEMGGVMCWRVPVLAVVFNKYPQLMVSGVSCRFLNREDHLSIK